MDKLKKFAVRAVNSTCHIRPGILLAAGILPLAAVLAFLFLGDKSLWLDEAFSVKFSQMDLPQFWQTVSQYEANQGLYYCTLHLWMVLGKSEFVLRSLSAILAVCSVAIIYVLGARLFGSKAGLIAALLMTLNAFFIAYAQEARAYMAALFLATLSSYFLVRSVENSSWKWWGAYVVSGVLGVYTHIFVALVLIAHFVSLLFLSRREVPWKGALASGAAMVLLLIPMGLFIFTRDIGQIGWIDKPRFVEIFWLFGQLSGRGGLFLAPVYLLLCLVALVFTINIYLKQKLSAEFWRLSLLLCWLFVPIIFTYLYSYFKPVFVPRYFVIVLPALVLFTAYGLSRVKPRFLMHGVLILVAALSAWPLTAWYRADSKDAYNQKDDWRGVTGYIVSSAKPGDAVIFYHPIIRVAFDYYYERLETTAGVPAIVYYLPAEEGNLNLYYLPEGTTYGDSIPYPDSSLLDRLSGYERVWLVFENASGDEKTDQGQVLQSIIQGKYSLDEEKNYIRDIRVVLYTLGESAP